MTASPSEIAPVSIAGRHVGAGHPTYVIAELSANHGQQLERAVELVRAAAASGADAVKLQTYTPDTMTIVSDRPEFRVGAGTPWEGRSLHELYGEAYTPWEWHEPLARAAAEAGVHLFSTPFDASAVEFLESHDVPAYKVASFELVDLELVRLVAATGKPVIMSTGMATVAEIDAAVTVARGSGAGGVVLLRTNSAYPAPADEMDLATIPHMAALWQVPVGLSDHTLGVAAAVAAVALGACVVEKHLTMSRADGGPDSSFSLEPAELADLVLAVRDAERAVGTVRYGPTPSEKASLAFRRSLFVVRPVRAGEELTRDNIRAIRPGHGLAPVHLDAVLGRHAAADVEPGTPLAWHHLA